MLKMLMKTFEDKDSVSYRIGCDCGANDHDLDVYAEVDESNIASIQFGAKLSTPHWYRTFEHPWLEWLNEPVMRVRLALTVLFSGYAECYHEFILGADNIKSLRYALDEIEKKIK